jgi:excisionase family DNA binding protein
MDSSTNNQSPHSDRPPKESSIDPRYFGIDGAASYCGLSAESIRRLLAAGRLTALRPIRGRVLIDKRQLDELVLRSDHKPRTGRGLSRRIDSND